MHWLPRKHIEIGKHVMLYLKLPYYWVYWTIHEAAVKSSGVAKRVIALNSI